MDQPISRTGPAALDALEQSSLRKEARALLGLKLICGESMPQACGRASQGSGGADPLLTPLESMTDCSGKG